MATGYMGRTVHWPGPSPSPHCCRCCNCLAAAPRAPARTPSQALRGHARPVSGLQQAQAAAASPLALSVHLFTCSQVSLVGHSHSDEAVAGGASHGSLGTNLAGTGKDEWESPVWGDAWPSRQRRTLRLLASMRAVGALTSMCLDGVWAGGLCLPRPFHRILWEVALGSAPALPRARPMSLTWAEGCRWGPQQERAGGQACEGCSSHNLIRPGFSLGGSGGDGGGWGPARTPNPSPGQAHTCRPGHVSAHQAPQAPALQALGRRPSSTPGSGCRALGLRTLQDRAWAGVSRKPELAAASASFQVSLSDPDAGQGLEALPLGPGPAKAQPSPNRP